MILMRVYILYITKKDKNYSLIKDFIINEQKVKVYDNLFDSIDILSWANDKGIRIQLTEIQLEVLNVALNLELNLKYA